MAKSNKLEVPKLVRISVSLPLAVDSALYAEARRQKISKTQLVAAMLGRFLKVAA